MKSFGKFAFICLAFTFLISACGQSNTGIQGKVVLANCTGQEIAVDCTAVGTYSATLEIYNDKLVKIKTVQTRGDGTFQVALKAGTYYIHPVAPVAHKFPQASDFKVVVAQGEMPDLTVYYDNGDRLVPTETP
jgi:hypothetical protein